VKKQQKVDSEVIQENVKKTKKKNKKKNAEYEEDLLLQSCIMEN